MMREVLSGVVLLLGICPSVLTVTFVCLANKDIQVTTVAGEMEDWYVHVAETGCTTYQQLTGTGGQTVTWDDDCFSYVLGTPFTLVMVPTNTGFVNDGSNTTRFTITCNADTEASVITSSVDVSPAPAIARTSTLSATVVLTLDQVAYTIGATVTGTITFGAGFAVEYVMGLQEVDLTVNGKALNIFTAGCPKSTAFAAALVGDSAVATSLTITFDAPYSIEGGAATAGAQALVVKVTVNICDRGVTTTRCYDPMACSSGRRKRDADSTQNAQHKSAKTVTTVLADNDSMAEYNKNMYDKLAAIYEPAKDEEMCVDKTVSVVILVILLVGMILCLMATIWMFFKLRKSRKLVNPETFEYSNKSFKR